MPVEAPVITGCWHDFLIVALEGADHRCILISQSGARRESRLQLCGTGEALDVELILFELLLFFVFVLPPLPWFFLRRGAKLQPLVRS